MAVGATVTDRVADHAAGGLVFPRRLARAGINGLEPAVHGPVEHEVTGGRHRPGPDREVLLYLPCRPAAHRVPGRELATVAARTGLHEHLRADERRAGDVAHLLTRPVHA